MDAVGYGELQPELNRLSKGALAGVGRVYRRTFRCLHHPGPAREIAGKLRDKYGDHADRLAIYAPYAAPDDGILSRRKGSWKWLAEIRPP